MSIDTLKLMFPTTDDAEGWGPSQFMLLMDSPVFTDLVEAAAVAVLTYFHPNSSHRRAVRNSGTDHHRLMDMIASDISRLAYGDDAHSKFLSGQMFSGGHLNVTLFKQFELVLEYVKWRNAHKACVVGEEHTTRQLAYAAVCAFQNYKVAKLEAGIVRDGFNFGSATGWFQTSYLGYVDDWPTRFKCIPVDFDVPEIPCKRPDWEQRRYDDRNKRLLAALEATIENIKERPVKISGQGDKIFYLHDFDAVARTAHVSSTDEDGNPQETMNVEWDVINEVGGTHVQRVANPSPSTFIDEEEDA